MDTRYRIDFSKKKKLRLDDNNCQKTFLNIE